MRNLARWPGLLLVFVLALLACRGAQAQASCPSAAWTITSSTPAIIYGTSAASTLYSGVLHFDSGVCTLTVSPNFVVATPSFVSISSATEQAIAVTGVNVISTGSPTATLVQNSGTCTIYADPIRIPSYTMNNQSSGGGLAPGPATCRFTADFPFEFRKPAGTMSGTLPANQLLAVANSISNTSNWVTWYNGLGGGWHPSAIAWTPQFVMLGCTVSTSNVTVPLPTVSKTSLASLGATAGLTPFTLGLTGCDSSGSTYVATATWSFTAGPSTSTLSNTAASPASNVYVQLLDSSMTPITNGGTTTLANVTAAGSYSATYYARYYANGTAGAGGVKGTATFTMSYL